MEDCKLVSTVDDCDAVGSMSSSAWEIWIQISGQILDDGARVTPLPPPLIYRGGRNQVSTAPKERY
jgi:hypothetical protein